MKLVVKLCACLIFTCLGAFGQIEDYKYKRELTGISEQWHKIVLPDAIFGKVSPAFTDIRIYGITASQDTLEVPYILRLASGKTTQKEVAFNTINTSYNEKGYYFTFEIPSTEPVNQIDLHFRQRNFDWQLKLEGSFNQSDWHTITDHYRILSIKNEITDFQFTKVVFSDSKYRYIRMIINSKEKPDLTQAGIVQQEHTDGVYKNFPIRKFTIKNHKEAKQTEIEIELEQPVPVCWLKLKIEDKFDYYRPVEIKYVTDSFKTEQGLQYNYSMLTSGTLNSMEENSFRFNSTIVKKLKIIIYNHDNQPLHLNTVQVEGYVHELTAQFTSEAHYFLTYGNSTAVKPDYEIENFIDKIPVVLTALDLGNEEVIGKEEIPAKTPFFHHKIWLWGIMALIILTLGWFSIKMLQRKA